MLVGYYKKKKKTKKSFQKILLKGIKIFKEKQKKCQYCGE